MKVVVKLLLLCVKKLEPLFSKVSYERIRGVFSFGSHSSSASSKRSCSSSICSFVNGKPSIIVTKSGSFITVLAKFPELVVHEGAKSGNVFDSKLSLSISFFFGLGLDRLVFCKDTMNCPQKGKSFLWNRCGIGLVWSTFTTSDWFGQVFVSRLIQVSRLHFRAFFR